MSSLAGAAADAAVGAVTHLLQLGFAGIYNAVISALTSLLFVTCDLSREGGLGWGPPQDVSQLPALTANHTVQAFGAVMRHMAEAAMVVLVMYSCFRAMFERKLLTNHSLKVILPRLLGAVLVMEFSGLFCQMAIDLDNAFDSVIFNFGGALQISQVPGFPNLAAWTAITAPADLALAGGMLALACILVITYFIRYALLMALIITAPVAGLLTVLPETRPWAGEWLRTFTVNLYVQPLQILLLKLSATLVFAQASLNTFAGLAVLWMVLKTPSALNSQTHFGSKFTTLMHHAETMARHTLRGTTRSHTSHTRHTTSSAGRGSAEAHPLSTRLAI
jgi:hypothetical protein